jgi:hypothetical protein
VAYPDGESRLVLAAASAPNHSPVPLTSEVVPDPGGDQRVYPSYNSLFSMEGTQFYMFLVIIPISGCLCPRGRGIGKLVPGYVVPGQVGDDSVFCHAQLFWSPKLPYKKFDILSACPLNISPSYLDIHRHTLPSSSNQPTSRQHEVLPINRSSLCSCWPRHRSSSHREASCCNYGWYVQHLRYPLPKNASNTT